MGEVCERKSIRGVWKGCDTLDDDDWMESDGYFP